MKPLAAITIFILIVAGILHTGTHPTENTTVVIVERPIPTALSRPTPQIIAKELLTAQSYKCWAQIVKAESHFNPKAKNPISDASGIGQLLRSTYASLGMKVTQDGTAQLVAMLAYVNRRFGGTNALCSAYKYHLQFFTY